MRMVRRDLVAACIREHCFLRKPDSLNLIAAAAPDFRFFIEINRDYSARLPDGQGKQGHRNR